MQLQETLELPLTPSRRPTMAPNASFVFPLADVQYLVHTDILGSFVDSLNGWIVALTLFLGIVLYDQCMLSISKMFWIGN